MVVIYTEMLSRSLLKTWLHACAAVDYFHAGGSQTLKNIRKCVYVYTIPKPGTETGAPSNRPILVCTLLFRFQPNTEANTGSEAVWIFWTKTMDNV